MRENKIRCNISIAPAVKERVDNEAYSMGMSSSAFITMCISNYFMQRDTLNGFNELQSLVESMGGVDGLKKGDKELSN